MTTYIVDTETTSKEDPEVIELGWIKLPTDEDLAGLSDRIPSVLIREEDFHSTYKPSKAISYGAMAVHHILPMDLEDAKPSESCKLPDDCTYMVGHSIDFDWQALGSPDIKRICTFAMAQHIWPDADSHSQSALLYMLLGPTEETRNMLRFAHTAYWDTQNNLVLLRRILGARPEITTWSELWRFSEDCRIPLRMPITKARGQLLTEIEDGLLWWCLKQDWLPEEHPYLHTGLVREYERRHPITEKRVAVADDDGDDMPF